MHWAAIALLSAGVSGLISIFDKTVIYRYAGTPLTLPLLAGFAATSMGLVITVTVQVPDDAAWEAVGWTLFSGLLFGLGGLLLMRVLYSQEVSRTIPVTQISPIFAAFIALAFLGETISTLQWAGILATVVGAMLLSLRIERVSSTIFLHRSFYLLVLSALIQAIATVIIKVGVDDLPVLLTHGLRMLGLGLVLLAFNFRPRPVRDIQGFVLKRSPALLVVALNELVIANGGFLLFLWALSEGPVSLVLALHSTRALFLVLYSTVLSLVWRGFLGEDTVPAVIALKIGATGLIVVGIVGIVL